MLKDLLPKYYLDRNYNCAEAILHAANEQYGLGLDEHAMKLVASFGGGIQCGNTCGAVLADAAVLSMLYVEERAHESRDIRPVCVALQRAFLQKYNSTLCKDIKLQSFRPEYRCRMTIETACDILEETIAAYEAARGKDA